MRVGVLTSWRVPCGIYQYSSRLVEAFARIPGVEPVVLAGRADEHRSVPEEWDGEVHDVAQIGLWRDDGAYALDVPYIGGLGLDVIHVQYQSMLFSQRLLYDLDLFRHGQFSFAITFHDNCQAPDFPYEAFDLHFSHRWNVGPTHLPSCAILPFGIEDRPPVVRTFGLGRTRADFIRPICEKHGWIFEDIASHEPIHGGGQQWRTHEDLMAWLRGADAIVLWYDDVGQAGESQAARTAIAARRPVITNDVRWFEELPPYAISPGATYYEKVTELEGLEVALEKHFRRPYVTEHSWDQVAQRLLTAYQTKIPCVPTTQR